MKDSKTTQKVGICTHRRVERANTSSLERDVSFSLPTHSSLLMFSVHLQILASRSFYLRSFVFFNEALVRWHQWNSNISYLRKNSSKLSLSTSGWRLAIFFLAQVSRSLSSWILLRMNLDQVIELQVQSCGVSVGVRERVLAIKRSSQVRSEINFHPRRKSSAFYGFLSNWPLICCWGWCVGE